MGAQMVYLPKPVVSKENEDGGDFAVHGLHYGVTGMQGWRRNMEDSHLAVTELDEKVGLFGVFDGHGGRGVSRYAAKHLPKLLRETEAYQQGDYARALEQAFLKVDEKLREAAGRKEVEELDKPDASVPTHPMAVPRRVLQRFLGNGVGGADEDDEAEGDEAAEPEEGGAAAPEGAAAAAADRGDAAKPEAAGKPEAAAAGEAERSGSNHPELGSSEENGDAKEKSDAKEGQRTKAAAEHVQAAEAQEEPREDEAAVAGAEDTTQEGDEEEEGHDDDGGDWVDIADEADHEAGDEDVEVVMDEDDNWAGEDMTFVDPSRLTRDPTPEAQGCTAVVVLVVRREGGEGPRLICANAGDSRAILSRKGQVVALSEDHKPENPGETARITKAGGFVQQMPGGARVQGDLNLSRAMGDLRYKKPDNLPPEEQIVTAFPEVRTFQLTGEDEFLVLGCDGIWERSGNQEMVDFVRPRLLARGDGGEAPVLSRICGEICDKGLCSSMDSSENDSFDGTGCDNMTVLIVQLQRELSDADSGDAARKRCADAAVEEAPNGKRPRQDGEEAQHLNGDSAPREAGPTSPPREPAMQ